MNRLPYLLTALAALAVTSAQAQVNNAPPGGRRGGPGGVEASVVRGASSASPQVNADNSVTFRLPAANAKKVQIFTDMPKTDNNPNGAKGFDMTKDDQGVWSYTTPPLKPSYYQYWFVMDGLTLPDPQDTFVRPASGVYKSMVAVPGKEADFMMFKDVPHGDLTQHLYINPDNKTERRVIIYTPPGYATSGKSYPVLYLLHGANDYELGWTQSGMANTIMDNLLAEGKAEPAIIVMPFGHDTTGSAGKLPEVRALQKELGYTAPTRGGRGAGGGGRGAGGPPAGGAPAAGAAAVAAGAGGPPAGGPPAGGPRAGGRRGGGGGGGPFGGSAYMEKDLLSIVMPYVEKEYRVIKDKDHRAIFGYSMGGGQSTSIGYGHPELFSYVAGFSGYGSENLLISDPAKANKNYKIIFIGGGTEDTTVPITTGRALDAAFTAAGVNHIWSEDPGYGHDYQIWRQYLYRLLQLTFRN